MYSTESRHIKVHKMQCNGLRARDGKGVYSQACFDLNAAKNWSDHARGVIIHMAALMATNLSSLCTHSKGYPTKRSI